MNGTFKLYFWNHIFNKELHLLGYNAKKSVESQPTFRGTFGLYLQGQIISQARNQYEAKHFASSLQALLNLLLCDVPSKRRLTFS
jgi:hypothetical protein